MERYTVIANGLEVGWYDDINLARYMARACKGHVVLWDTLYGEVVEVVK